jgi:hypothetical protein
MASATSIKSKEFGAIMTLPQVAFLEEELDVREFQAHWGCFWIILGEACAWPPVSLS